MKYKSNHRLKHWKSIFGFLDSTRQFVPLYPWVSLVAQTVKNLPAMQETQVQSLGWEDPLGKVLATHSSILAWGIPRTKKSGGLQSMGSQRVRNDWATNTNATEPSWEWWGVWNPASIPFSRSCPLIGTASVLRSSYLLQITRKTSYRPAVALCVTS